MPEARGVWGLGKKGEVIGKYRLVITTQLQDVQHSTGITVNNIVIAMYGASWVLEISGGPLCKGYDCLATILYT